MMAVDLRNRLNDLLNINIPMVVIMQGPTFDELLENVEALVTPQAAIAPAVNTEDPVAVVRGFVRSALGFEDDVALREDQSLLELGLDSMMAVEIRNQLNDHLGINLPMVVIMQGPTLPELEAAVKHALAESTPAPQPGSTGSKTTATGDEVDTAFERLVLTHVGTFAVGGVLASLAWWLLG